jgi:glutathione-independent formaldehyde dehydrogenase
VHVNPIQPGGAYGYVNMGYWPGGQAEYVMVPYADFQCLKFPKNITRDQFLDIALLSDIFPTAYDGAVKAMVSPGKSVYIAGAGPVGLCCVASCKLLGAGFIFIGDYETQRLENARAMGAIPIDLNKEKPEDRIKAYIPMGMVDCSVDCVGYESNGHHGKERRELKEKSEVLNTCFRVTKPAGGIGIPGLYLPQDPGATTPEGKSGNFLLEFGTAWNKGIQMAGGQCPVMMHNRMLLKAILAGRIQVAKYLQPTIISLDEAPAAYKDFIEGAPRKYIIDPHGIISKMGLPTMK